jgi:thiamine biosynthesis protein ThiS
MLVTINGEARQVAADTSLADLLAALGLDARSVAVERNGEVVPRSRHPEVRVADGDRLEVVRFVQGG